MEGGRIDLRGPIRRVVAISRYRNFYDGPAAARFRPFSPVRWAGDDTQPCHVPLEDVMDGVEVIDGW